MTLEEAKQLSPEEINRCIAEALGWRLNAFTPPGSSSGLPRIWYSPLGVQFAEMPDYFHNLNACNSAEKTLDYMEQCDYPYHCLGLIPFDCPIKHGDLFELTNTPPKKRAIALAVVLSERKK